MTPRLLIIGAGGHARVVVSIVRHLPDWEIAGVLDRIRPASAEQIAGVSVIGDFDDGAKFFAAGVRHAALAIGDNNERAALFARFSALGFTFPVLRHPTAIVEEGATLGDGCVVCAGAIIGTQAVLGRGVIVNTGAIIDHETVIGDHAHLAPGCRVAGRVRIGELTMLGLGACVRDKISIGARSLVGAGAVVVTDIPADVVAQGVPARVARLRTP